MTRTTRSAAPGHGTGRRRKRVLLTGPQARLVVSEHARQDKQLLELLSRRSA